MGKRFKKSSPPQDLDSPVKLLFGLYQCLHHLSFLTGDVKTANGPMFGRKVEELDRFFIPALPTWNSLFKKRCHATNEKWRQEQIGNLTEHYQWCTEALKGSISAYNLTSLAMISNLNIARKWAQQHFRKKFQNNLFDKVDQMVRKLAFSESTAKRPAPSSSSQNRAEPEKVSRPAEEVTSTPTRKRGRPSLSETSPTQTPSKRTRSSTSTPGPSTYAQKAKSPTIRPHASTQKDNPAVDKFPRLPPHQRGSSMMHSIWRIPKVTKDILVLGTSNLARVSFVARRDAQVVSYPGLKIDSLLKLLTAFQFGPKSKDPGRQPSHVVLSVGINDRGLAPATNHVNIKKVIQEAKRQFPESKISVYQQPFDSKLTKKEKDTLVNLNETIEKECKSHNLNCIRKIDRVKFAIAPSGNDLIHWTEDCANATVDHFFNCLN